MAPDKGHAVVALEVSGKSCGSWLGRSNLERRVFDGIDFAPDLGKFEAVASSNVVEHLHPDDCTDLLNQSLEVLSPNGTLVLVTPNTVTEPHDV